MQPPCKPPECGLIPQKGGKQEKARRHHWLEKNGLVFKNHPFYNKIYRIVSVTNSFDLSDQITPLQNNKCALEARKIEFRKLV